MKPTLDYVHLPDGMAKVVCADCGWEEEPTRRGPFDPAEAIMAASVEHLHCSSTARTTHLKTGERVTIDERCTEGVCVMIDRHRTRVAAETAADCLDTFAAQFKTLALELEQMALARRGGSS